MLWLILGVMEKKHGNYHLRDNGKENLNSYLGFRVYGFGISSSGFRIQALGAKVCYFKLWTIVPWEWDLKPALDGLLLNVGYPGPKPTYNPIYGGYMGIMEKKMETTI